VKADWTRRDAAIAAELARYGRNGVPLYLYFPANRAGAPDVLPELLTEDILLSTLARS
jgi:thiol:disulfide interchange protein DsbD